MNIAIFTDTYLPQINGVVTSIEIFRQTLQDFGHNVYIFAPAIGNRKQKDEPNVFRFRSAKFVFQPEYRISWPYSRALKKFNELDVDIIHAQTPFSMGLLAVYLAKKNKKPLIHTYHTLFSEYVHYLPIPGDYAKNFAQWASKSYCDNNNIVIVPSQQIKEELENYQVTAPIEIIPTGIKITDVNKVNTEDAAKKYKLDPGLKYLITVSRLGKEKNISFVIEAFARVHRIVSETRLIIVGDGPERKSIEKQIAGLGLTDATILTGYIPREEIFPLLKLSTAFIFGSKTETQGLVLLEAMSMKTPAVAIDSMGVSDVLKGNIGGFLAEDRLENFGTKVIDLITQPKIYEKKCREAYERAMSLSAEKMTQRLIECYEKNL